MHECNALNTCQGLTSDIKDPTRWKHLVVNRAKTQLSTVSHKSFQFPLQITTDEQFYFTSQNYSSQLLVIGFTLVNSGAGAGAALLVKWKLLWLKGATVAHIFPVSSPDNNRRAAVLLHLPKLLLPTVCDRFHSGELCCCCCTVAALLLKWKLLWLMIGGNSYLSLSSPHLAKTF